LFKGGILVTLLIGRELGIVQSVIFHKKSHFFTFECTSESNFCDITAKLWFVWFKISIHFRQYNKYSDNLLLVQSTYSKEISIILFFSDGKCTSFKTS